MLKFSLILFLSTIIYYINTCTGDATSGTYQIQMPGIRTTKDDDYWCYTQSLENSTLYITEFLPIYDPSVTHHMILLACVEPERTHSAWKCNSMDGDGAPLCLGLQPIIFAWAMEASPFKLPNDVSFKVGAGTPFKYLVLQVHYKDAAAFQKDQRKEDHSGFKLSVQQVTTPKLAGIYTFISDGYIAPNAETTLIVGCKYSGMVPFHPFAFRVHAHNHGVLNTARILHEDQSYLIGAMSPQMEQTFYYVKNASLVVNPGDWMEAKCIMKNKRFRAIPIGATRKEEMCNFYMMYWVKQNETKQLYDPQNQICFSDQNPTHYSSMKVKSSESSIDDQSGLAVHRLNDEEIREYYNFYDDEPDEGMNPYVNRQMIHNFPDYWLDVY